ncbi:hypothetical protein ACFXPY_30230 [Streptomyces sp. NPDC059153]|uniref:hypothetical protein n=1 Tax=Streptomyces sp. NPDC059153 TaxID=3346743 RepID=UPI0036B7FE31
MSAEPCALPARNTRVRKALRTGTEVAVEVRGPRERHGAVTAVDGVDPDSADRRRRPRAGTVRRDESAPTGLTARATVM